MFAARYYAPRYYPGGYWARGATAAGSYLSAQALLSMRAVVAGSLPDRVTIRRRTLTDDGQGGRTETWADQAGRRGRLYRRSGGQERETDGRITAETAWGLVLAYGADVQPQDRVVTESAEYEVVAVRHRGTERLEVEAELRRLA